MRITYVIKTPYKMNLKLCLAYLCILSIAISSCENQLPDSETAVVTDKNMKLFNVKESGYDLQISLSESELTEDTKFVFDRSFGHVKFEIDENFNFTLTQEEVGLDQIKKELEGETLFSYKYRNGRF